MPPWMTISILENAELTYQSNSKNGGQTQKTPIPLPATGFIFFFFLHCRTSARHCRSTTGMSEERNQISPKAKANKNKHTNQATTPTKSQTRQRSREICNQRFKSRSLQACNASSHVSDTSIPLPWLKTVREQNVSALVCSRSMFKANYHLQKESSNSPKTHT